MNKLEKPSQQDIAGPSARHTTTQVMVGNVAVGGGAPIVVQSMTNTDTAAVAGTVAQVAALSRAGSEMVRITVDREEAAAAVPHIRDGLRKSGINTHLIGDFHNIGPKLLAASPPIRGALRTRGLYNAPDRRFPLYRPHAAAGIPGLRRGARQIPHQPR